MLPPAQFRGCLGCNTTNTVLFITHKIKDAWRQGKVAAALFLDVQGAFPNTVKDQLIHNMKTWCVPKCFTDLTALMLTGRTTHLKFNDFISEPLPIDNGTTQGDPSSMLFFSFYNSPLISVATSVNKLLAGFVDNLMLLVVSDCYETSKKISR